MTTTIHRTTILTGLALLALCASLRAQQVEPYSALNSPADDYASAFRVMPNGEEIWITTSREVAGQRSKKTMYLRVGANGPETPMPVAVPINQVATDNNAVTLDGCPTFSFCDDTSGIIATNRTVNGKNYDNDLYALTLRNGNWNVDRIDALSSPAWDDTPALSSDCGFLYFASDRRNPGSGRTDIFMSARGVNGWSDPVPVDEINTYQYSEQAPYVGTDGYLYYTTNQTQQGDYDIWRVQLNPVTGRPSGTPSAVDIAGVNQPGSDEGHPVLSPGGNWFLFSSNRGPKGVKDFDIYRVKLAPASSQRMLLQVRLRTQSYDQYTQAYEDATSPIATTITVYDQDTRQISTYRSSDKGECTLDLARIVGSDPSLDLRTRTVIVRAEPPSPKFVSSSDTLVFDVSCNGDLNHTLYLWDTAVYYNPVCKQDFPITNVQFFITGYWCPTTIQYEKYTPCQSVFPSTECTTVDVQKPELACQEDDIYRYTLHYTAPTIEAARQPGLCMDMNEARTRRSEFAQHVDSAIAKFVDNMRVALRAPCVQRSIAKGNPVKVEITGWTDPRPLDPLCLYTGNDIDLNRSFIKLAGIESKSYIRDGILRNGTHFRESGANGNQLLSELRAYYTAVLLDSVWSEQVAEYRALRSQPSMLDVIAVGRAISQDNVPFERRRSVNVVVTTPLDEEAPKPGHLATPGGAIVVCGQVCSPVLATRMQMRKFSQSQPPSDIRNVSNESVQPAVQVEVQAEQPSLQAVAPSTPQQPMRAQRMRSSSESSTTSPQQAGCYTIRFTSQTDETKAKQIKAALMGQEIRDAHVDLYIAPNGARYYRVLSGCYESLSQAQSALQQAEFASKVVGLSTKPVIVR
jgi:hypothetical protein